MWLPLTPLDSYRRGRTLLGSKTAIVDGERRFTFAEHADRVERLAGALRALGLRPREPVSVVSGNGHAVLEAFSAVPLAGGIVHPVSPRLTPLELAPLVNDAGSRTLIFHAAATTAVREALGNLKAVEHLVVVGGSARGLDFPVLEYEALLAGAAPFAPDPTTLDEHAPCALFHTSGGAERPRGVLLSHRTLALHALHAALAVGLREDDVVLCSVPFSYMNGGGSPQMDLLVGATSVLTVRHDPPALLDLVSREKVTVWTTTPTDLRRLMEQPRLSLRLRLVLVGGAPLTPALVREAEERLGAQVVSVYGLTETSPYISAAFAPPGVLGPERHLLQATAGRPIPGVEVRVVDDAGREVPPDGEAMGEILVRGHGVMTGYHRDPEATARTMRGGWLHTGDLASMDARGFLTLRGRTTDEVVVGGMRISAGEIEAALQSHPDVARAAVVASPDVERGEAPVAIVVRRAGARVTEAELQAWAAGRLARFKLPRRIEFVDALPVTEGGEVVKSELRTLYTS